MNGKIIRKIGAALLAAVMLSSLSACGGKEPEGGGTTSKAAVSHPVDVIGEAKAGKLTGTDVFIGRSAEEVKKLYHYGEEDTLSTSLASDDEEPLILTITEGETMVRMATGQVDYYYRKAKEEKGISMIVSMVDCYGFEAGITMPDDVKNAIAEDGAESAPTEDDLFFLPEVPADCLRLTYTAGSQQLDFYFVDEFLAAVTLSQPDWWKLDEDAVVGSGSEASSESSSEASSSSSSASGSVGASSNADA
ncbi:MAG: hypothetical protein HFE86_00735 [Clostridiales bacterium]|nr:hypothetical protein [Clostridiales bacterium]